MSSCNPDMGVSRRRISSPVAGVMIVSYLATGTYPFIGEAQGEAKLTDAVSGQLLGDWVDKRVSGGSIKATAPWQWGDAENAMKE
jgi:uncharacterized protein DUF3313